MEAETVDRADRRSFCFGVLALRYAAGFNSGDSCFTAEIETEDRVISLTASAVTVANAATAYINFGPRPAGVIFDDGLLDITVVSPVSRAGRSQLSLTANRLRH